MKFISKNSNLRIILRNGIPAEPMTGRSAVPTVSVKFEDGVVNVNNEEQIQMMLAHAAYNIDFIKAEGEDPYANTRKSVEPEHDITEIQYGHIGKAVNPKSPISLNVEQKTMLQEMAKNMAKEMMMEMMKDSNFRPAAPVNEELPEKEETVADTEPEKEEAVKPEVKKPANTSRRPANNRRVASKAKK